MKMENLRDHLNEVQEKIDYQFENIDLLLQAFTRSSYSSQFGSENNEVLEFIGDKVLDFYVTKIIAENFGFLKSESILYDIDTDADEFCIVANKNESAFTELRKDIVNNKTLAHKIDSLGLFKYMYLGDSDLDNPKFKDNLVKVKADLFEAIIGSIAIDSNWDPEILQNSVSQLLRIEEFLADVDTKEERPNKFKEENSINTLKELSEHGKCSIPEYIQPNEQVVLKDGRVMWECTCIIRSWGITTTAYGVSKKIAKKYSAYLTLCKYYNLPNEYEED